MFAMILKEYIRLINLVEPCHPEIDNFRSELATCFDTLGRLC